MAIKEAPVLEQTYNRLVELSADDSARMLADAREKARRDASAVKESAYLDGRDDGQAKLIRAMLDQGIPLDGVARFTDLSVDQINRLLKR